MRHLALAALLILLPGFASAQSWCGAANLNQTEATICGVPQLGGLDAQMTVIYDRVKDRQTNLRGDQSAWLAARNFCRTDMLCIETAYRERLSVLRQIPGRRPVWCSATTLGPTEAAICATPLLGHLDAELGALYQRAGPSLQAVQRQWLRQERDTCGADAFCIEQAYLSRLADLRL